MQVLALILAFVAAATAQDESRPKPAHGFDVNPVQLISDEACKWILSGGACTEFQASRRDMIGAFSSAWLPSKLISICAGLIGAQT